MYLPLLMLLYVRNYVPTRRHSGIRRIHVSVHQGSLLAVNRRCLFNMKFVLS